MQLVYVYGTDYCGSTLLDRLFWNLPDVAAPGELHWLFDAPRQGRIPTCGEHEVERSCAIHGANCEALGRPWVEQDFDMFSLYEVVAARLRAGVLVSSDKNWYHYRRMTMGCDRGEMVVLFKSPAAYAWSRKCHEGASIETSLADWLRTYGASAPSKGIRVSYDRLASQPNQIMRRLCSYLGLPSWLEIDTQTYLTSRNFHHIGGNPGALRAHPIEVDTSWQTKMNTMDKAAVELNTEADQLYTQLCKESL